MYVHIHKVKMYCVVNFRNKSVKLTSSHIPPVLLKAAHNLHAGSLTKVRDFFNLNKMIWNQWVTNSTKPVWSELGRESLMLRVMRVKQDEEVFQLWHIRAETL